MPHRRAPGPASAAYDDAPGADYRLLFQSNPQPMWVFDRESLRFLAVNDAAVARYGYTAAEFLAMTILDIRPPEDREVVRDVVDALPEQGLGAPGCWRHLTKSGRIIDVELSTHLVTFEGHQAVMVLAIDVTSQVETQRHAEQQERKLRALNEALERERTWLLRSQEVAKIGAWETDLQTLEVQWSAGTFHIFGLDLLTFQPTHTTFLDHVHPDDRDLVNDAFYRSFQTREMCTVRHRIIAATGATKIVEERWYTTVDEAGAPARAYGTCQDISEREATGVALQLSEARYRTVFDTAATGILLTDRDGVLLEVNPAFAAMLGYAAGELRGREFQAITHPDDRDANFAVLEELMAGTRHFAVMEKRYLHRDGRTIWCRLRIAALEAADGTRNRAITVVEDITHARAMTEALERSEAQLQMASALARLGAWSVELPDEVLTVSRAARVIQDLDPGEPITVEEAIALYIPEHRPVIREAYTQCLRNGRDFELELRIVTRRGRPIWVRALGHAARAEDGRIVRVEGALQDVTARVEAEERERRLTGDLTAVLESISDAFFTLDDDWRFIFVNRQAEILVHRGRAELLGRSIWEVFPEAVGSEFETHYRRAMATGETVEFESYYPPLQTWFSVRAYPSPTRLAVYFRDVTARRRAEEAMRVSEERFRLLARATNDAIWDWDLRTNGLWWNEGYESLFGYDRRTVSPTIDSWISLVHPEDVARVTSAIHEAIDADVDQWSDEYRFRRKDGSYAYVLDRGHIIRVDGEAVRMIGGMTDLTDRKAAEERLAEQAALLDSAHEAILVKDLDDRIVYWNKGAERTYGWSADAALGRWSPELFVVDRERHQEGWRLLMEHGFWEGELRRRGKDGRDQLVEVRWTLVRRPDQSPRAVFAIHTDVTERRRIEAQFLRAQRLDSLGTLAGGIAHDLNNVLTPVLAGLSMLREPASETERLEALETIEDSVRRGAAMVRQVLMFARGAEGRREPVDIRHVVEQVAKIVRETFPKSIRLVLEAPRGLRGVTIDPTQLHQVVLNLCVNARDAMPQGGTLTLEVAEMAVGAAEVAGHPGVHPGDFIRISVTDQGHGIPREIQDHIFEPFFTTKEPGQGTGLGLSTVHSIVRNHGGFVTLLSGPGQGARFDIYLPAEAIVAAQGVAAAESERLPRGDGELVLVVDDEEAIRRVLRRMLERHGYKVLEAAHGAEGVAQFARHRREIAVVLTDMSMPVMDGPAMIAALRTMTPEVRIIASSGLAEDRTMAQAVADGTRAVVPKPFTAENLLTTLHRVLQPSG